VTTVGNEMTEPRKVFRIEQTAAARLERRVDSAAGPPHHGEIMQALGALQALLAASPQALPTVAAAAAPRDRRGGDAAFPAAKMTRIAQELGAITAGTAQATQKILAAAEEIDQLANTLSAALKGRIEQDLAQDISDCVLHIFEACNFQDLIGQRVGKVMKTLTADDAPPARTDDPAADIAPEMAPDLHGPRLDIDNGHLSQREIDAMFDG